MTSDLHEEIIDDVTAVLNMALQPMYPDLEQPGSFSVFVEANIANAILGIAGKGSNGRTQAADAYIIPDDGHSVILVEVGSMRNGKWDHLKHNGKPVRLLRITKERAFGMVNRRNTQFEQDLLDALSKWLHRTDELRTTFQATLVRR